MYKITILFFAVSLQTLCMRSFAQDSLLINFLIQKIAAQQVQQDAFFLPGIFPSYISNNEKFSDKKKDNNIFFNGLIAYTLHQTEPFLTTAQRIKVDSIFIKAAPLFKRFKNKNRATYNFWRTDSAYAYPYTGVLKLFTKDITLPDDMDDTVLSLLALDADNSTAAAIHAIMQQFVNSDTNKVRSVISAYNSKPAYSTWFGKKFPVVFDVSVLCNILCFNAAYQLPWTNADSASLNVILETIKHDYHLSQPVYASPYYPKTSLILYHIARLMSVQQIPALEALKIKLVSDAAKALVQTDNLMERIILSSAIIKWGYMPPAVVLPAMKDIENELVKNDFCFFVGNIPSYFKDGFKKIATDKNIGFYYHYCPAYNEALLLEYLLLKNR